MADERTQKPATDRSATGASKQSDDQGKDKTLTEKTEEQAGGKNKDTPGKIHDV
ncbi:hypothetical protein [Azospirillum sp.]|uniref:hypothetical protein n=1 Tax=Azospirillum sp. TaxID=34012 RepID=UPI003D733033